ncbi:hypothetical protein QOT17_003011 [Balamuthia mandrillaris]
MVSSTLWLPQQSSELKRYGQLERQADRPGRALLGGRAATGGTSQPDLGLLAQRQRGGGGKDLSEVVRLQPSSPSPETLPAMGLFFLVCLAMGQRERMLLERGGLFLGG